MQTSYDHARAAYQANAAATLAFFDELQSFRAPDAQRLNAALREASRRIQEEGLHVASIETLKDEGWFRTGIGKRVVGVRIYHWASAARA